MKDNSMKETLAPVFRPAMLKASPAALFCVLVGMLGAGGFIGAVFAPEGQAAARGFILGVFGLGGAYLLLKREFSTHRTDAGVSPVIAVILMVAITVVLSAVVYTWVTQFSGGAAGEVPGSLSIQRAGHDGDEWQFTATSASGVDWSDLRVLVGSELEYDADPGWCAQREGACIDPDGEAIRAGDVLALYGVAEGETLRVVDVPANAILLELELR